MGIGAIFALVSAGLSIADEMIDDDSKTASWVKLGQLVTKGVAGAVEAWNKIQSWHASGVTPDDAELEQCRAVVHANSAAIQAHQD